MGNDNRDLSYVVRLIPLHVLNLVKQSIFSLFCIILLSNMSTSDLKGIFIRISVLGDGVGNVLSSLDSQSGGPKSLYDHQMDRFTGSLQFNSWTSLINRDCLGLGFYNHVTSELNHLLFGWVACEKAG